MPQLRELLNQHLTGRGVSARAFAERIGISYPTVLALLHKGSVPRKPEHREVLRRELGLEQDDWAAVLAASQRDGIDIPREGPLSLRQLVLKAMLAQGHTEQSFARISGIPYATIMGVTRKGAIPRADTLSALGLQLGIGESEIQDAAARSRAGRAIEGFEPSGEVVLLAGADTQDRGPDSQANGNGGHAGDLDDGEPPFLAQVVADRIASERVSVAAFARANTLPYISLHRLLETGVAPERAEVLTALKRAVGLDTERFSKSLERSIAQPTPAAQPQDEVELTPLQEALHALVKSRNLTTKAFAELADLSVLTATKLLKHGDLPGRVSTHDKLRSLLQLSQQDYEELVRRSRGAIGERTAAQTGPEGPSLEELVALVRTLAPRARAAVKHFISSLGPPA